jgi:tRNA-intron endonuclease
VIPSIYLGIYVIVEVKAHLKVTDEGKVVIEKCLDQEFCANLVRIGVADLRGNVELLEALHLLATRRIAIEGKTGWEKALKYARKFNIKLSLFMVYHDLRKKGRKAKLGTRPGTLILNIGSRRTEILVLEEGVLMTLEDLAEWSRSSMSSGYEPVIAIVDRYGVITYYEARAVNSIT